MFLTQHKVLFLQLSYIKRSVRKKSLTADFNNAPWFLAFLHCYNKNNNNNNNNNNKIIIIIVTTTIIIIIVIITTIMIVIMIIKNYITQFHMHDHMSATQK